MSDMIPACGNRLIDAYHRRLSDVLRDAAACVREDPRHPGFGTIIAHFRTVLAEHFETEAVILRGAGFAEAEAHMAKHEAILALIDTQAGALAAQDGGPQRHALIQDLERVLYEHELLEDTQYWDDVRSEQALGDLVFDETIRIGIDWIDLQHRDLVYTVNELRQAARANDTSLIEALMERFVRHARQHFADEERHLEAMGKPISQHRHGHHHLLEALERMASQATTDPSAIAGDYMKFWLVDHIKGDDRRDFGT